MKICFVTGSRADYGLLQPLIKKFQSDKNLKQVLLLLELIYLKSMEPL